MRVIARECGIEVRGVHVGQQGMGTIERAWRRHGDAAEIKADGAQGH